MKKEEERRLQVTGYTRYNFIITLLIVLYNSYFSIISEALAALPCITLDSTSTATYLDVYPDIQCNTWKHRLVFYGTTLPILTIWGVGTPLLLFIYVRTSMKDKEHHNIGAIQSIISNYKSSFCYWESVVYIQRYVLMVLIVIVQGMNTQIKVTCIVFLLSLYYFSIIYLKPHKYASVDRIEAISFLIVITTLMLGYLSATEEAGKLANSALAGFMMFINGIFFVFAGLVMGKGIIAENIMKNEKLAKLFKRFDNYINDAELAFCLLYTSPSPRDRQKSRMPSSA
eukprot:TRINITY_DN6603_c0_g1_i1.p1 TRINITY_DN6603_c0_g1~~TRINITY_DN6603_c0_g1_i1.p1  ORF type:complete len:285 (+),score=24.63 TRINITY_DN6603_c0_g1_i1:336-1190(+)